MAEHFCLLSLIDQILKNTTQGYFCFFQKKKKAYNIFPWLFGSFLFAIVPSALIMAVGELVGGAFLSAFLQVLFDRLASPEVIALFRGKEVLLNDLNTSLNSANQLLCDAENKLIKDKKVKEWLDEIKETVYEADDVFYKINTEALFRNKPESESESNFTEVR